MVSRFSSSRTRILHAAVFISVVIAAISASAAGDDAVDLKVNVKLGGKYGRKIFRNGLLNGLIGNGGSHIGQLHPSLPLPPNVGLVSPPPHSPETPSSGAPSPPQTPSTHHPPYPILYTAPVSKTPQRNVSKPGVPFVKPRQFLVAHNKVRAAFNEPPLTWNRTLARYAKRYVSTRAADCKMVHTDGQYGGENIFWAKRADLWTPVKVVENWAEEEASFDSSNNRCVGDKLCGHFTQMVWLDTKSIGCAMVTCFNGGMLTMCYYYPPGNFVDESPFVNHI